MFFHQAQEQFYNSVYQVVGGDIGGSVTPPTEETFTLNFTEDLESYTIGHEVEVSYSIAERVGFLFSGIELVRWEGVAKVPKQCCGSCTSCGACTRQIKAS